MKISSSQLNLASTHTRKTEYEQQESLKVWIGNRRPTFAGEAPRPTPSPITTTDTVTLSSSGPAATHKSGHADDSDTTDADPRTQLIRIMLEWLTGRPMRVFDHADMQPADSPAQATPPVNATGVATAPPTAGYGVEYDRHARYAEFEETHFSASGQITTADGREIRFELHLTMSRSYIEESSTQIRLGDAARKVDPLVLNFAGTAAQLADQTFRFDLDADGHTEDLHTLAPGSGFLVFDRNANGRVDNGTELFGPSSNDGFAELARMDDDGNAWIDENDSAYQQLQLWNPGEPDSALQSLADAGIGAIALSRLATPFDLTNNANELFGQIRNSGIFLLENGNAGTIQQIDLVA